MPAPGPPGAHRKNSFDPLSDCVAEIAVLNRNVFARVGKQNYKYQLIRSTGSAHTSCTTSRKHPSDYFSWITDVLGPHEMEDLNLTSIDRIICYVLALRYAQIFLPYFFSHCSMILLARGTQTISGDQVAKGLHSPEGPPQAL